MDLRVHTLTMKCSRLVAHPYRILVMPRDRGTYSRCPNSSTAISEFRLQSLSKPFVKFTLPYNRILRMQHPMIFIWQVNQLAFDASQLGGQIGRASCRERV